MSSVVNVCPVYPKAIKKLDQRVVSRINAGEVIHRPINVVKELIENSLDANSTTIEVIVKDGGMKSIVIQDNGCGIQKEDLEIVCERFTTSKLREFEDLLDIQTYGFRGEALAAISHISYVTIVTKTSQQLCGFKLQFIDGKPKDKVLPMAANGGTVITVDNLFYNLPMRKNALNSHSNEYNLILDLLTKYAINNSNKASFSLKKFGDNFDLNTNIDNKLVENIRGLYGANIANNLNELSFEDLNSLKFSMSGYASNQNIHQKSFVFILFINNRLVECPPLKKAIDLVYSNYLLKSCHPFVYLDIKIESKNIDVNVHPTKNEVHFLHEQEICEKVIEIIESKLTDGRETRQLNSQPNTLINTVFSQISGSSQTSSADESPQQKALKTKQQMNDKSPKVSERETTPRRPNKQIRTDSKDRKIDEYLLNAKTNNKLRRDLRLTSVSSLRQTVANESDSRLQDIICNSTYVGCADEMFILLQFETQLLLVNAYNLNVELFYQLFLVDFGNFSKIKLSEPLLISDLLKLHLDDGFNDNESDNSQTNEPLDINTIEELIMEKREMLSDYFSIDISLSKQLLSLPAILEGLVPNFAYLPQFLYNLTKDVDWHKEKECFEGIGKVFAKFYAKPPKKFKSDSEHQKWAKTVETLIYPKYKQLLCPPKSLSDNSTFFVTTNLTDLYKVFERC